MNINIRNIRKLPYLARLEMIKSFDIEDFIKEIKQLFIDFPDYRDDYIIDLIISKCFNYPNYLIDFYSIPCINILKLTEKICKYYIVDSLQNKLHISTIKNILLNIKTHQIGYFETIRLFEDYIINLYKFNVKTLNSLQWDYDMEWIVKHVPEINVWNIINVMFEINGNNNSTIQIIKRIMHDLSIHDPLRIKIQNYLDIQDIIV
jgi:hypothetical protein